jgi:hypothetical protein
MKLFKGMSKNQNPRRRRPMPSKMFLTREMRIGGKAEKRFSQPQPLRLVD